MKRMATASAKSKCQLCGGAMEPGYIVDYAHAGVAMQGQWAAGEPKHSFWTGKKMIKRPRQFMHVESYRCTKCGYLMEFATKQEST